MLVLLLTQVASQQLKSQVASASSPFSAMSLTEFAMVEELASLIRDNLPCKYLVLSVEEALVNFIQDDTSSNGILELEPMNSYSRLLIHRLADIFGFSHHSVGEGDDRHLVLERCPETSIPTILVSDLLWQYDELESPRILEVAKRKEDSPGLNAEKPNFDLSLSEREAAYLAARERIFSVDEYVTGQPVKQRPQNNPIVARRMIAHALGQRIRPSSQEVSQGDDAKELQDPGKCVKIQEEDKGASSVGTQTFPERIGPTGKDLKPDSTEKASMLSGSSSLHSQTRRPQENVYKSTAKSLASCKEGGESNIPKASFTQEHMGAAKRMFANALGFHPKNSNVPKSSQSKVE